MNDNDTDPLRVESRTFDSEEKPDLRGIKSIILREGPRAKTEMTYLHIRDRHTGEHHHDSVSIKTYRKKGGEWKQDPSKSVGFSDDGEDEIQKVLDFINANRKGAIPEEDAEYLVVGAPNSEVDPDAFYRFLEDLKTGDRLDVLMQILESAAGNPEMLDALLKRASEDPKLFAEAAAALNLATYRRALGSV